jgi:pilus assembly protein TadC
MGGTFGGNLEIFFSIQLLTMLIGGAALSVVLLTDLPKFIEVALAGIGALLPVWPYNEANQKALKRSRRITMELPDFAELLIMVLPSMSIPQALSFTAEHVDGEVSIEMRNLVRTLVTHTMTDDEAFSYTASRLGTVEGRQFVDALRDAHLEGTRVVDSIKSQSESLRRISFQHRRAMAKQLPMKLTFIFALHFMPLLFALAFLPVVYGLGRAL